MASGKPKILIIDHEQRNLVSLAAAFRQKGWEVVSAGDAVMAQSVLLKVKPDAAVLNAQVPGGGGLTTLKRMRASVHTVVTPVIAIIGKTGAQAPEMLSAGVQECIPAPFEGAQVCASVERHLGQPHGFVAQAPSDVLADTARLNALNATGLLDSPSDERFDQLVALAAKLLAALSATLTLVDKDRQFYKSQIGMREPFASARQTPLSHSFCQWVVSGREEVVINDARGHRVLQNNQAVRDLGVIAYAGVPVAGEGGAALGSLCAVDSKPRQWTAEDIANLRDIAKLLEGYIAEAEPPSGASEGKGGERRLKAAREAILGAVGLLRRDEQRLEPEERAILLSVIERCAQHSIR